VRLHHVQVGLPAGGEDEARRFYGEGLGLAEIPKPPELARRGGAWFGSPGGAEIHLGVEDPHIPPARAHPALAVESEAELEELGQRLADMGYDVDWSQRHNASRFQRFHVLDPFGNRVEVVWPAPLIDPWVSSRPSAGRCQGRTCNGSCVRALSLPGVTVPFDSDLVKEDTLTDDLSVPRQRNSEMTGVVNRVRRAQGQLGGVLRMIEEGRDLADVISQLKAVTRALDKAAFTMLVGELSKKASCGAEPEEIAELERVFLSLS